MLAGRVGRTERETDAGVGVEPPQAIFLPGRERIRTDRFDVDERDQTEHLEQLFAADEGGEPCEDIRVPGVATERDPRHLAMMADEEPQGLGRGRRQLQAIDGGLREPQALARVTVIAARPDVVEEQRERQQLGRPQLLEQAGEAGPRRAARISQHLDAADRQHGMRTGRMATVRIRCRTAVNRLQFGEEPLEQAAFGHLEQPRRHARPRVQQVQHRLAVEVGGHEIVCRAVLEVFLDTGPRLVRHGAAVGDGDAKGVDPDRGLHRRGIWVTETDTVERDRDVPGGAPQCGMKLCRRCGHVYGGPS